MMKIFISDAVVSRGYDGAPAIRLFNSENGGEFAVFQVGIRKYDSRAENNHRWVNLKVKAFGDLCERIKKMSLKEGSFQDGEDPSDWDGRMAMTSCCPALERDQV